jgi:type II secretory pathway predicted ATPase ExeA
MNQRLLALYGLKWNPFSPELPIEAIYVPPKLENFCWRIEHAQIREGGFAMIHGDPGTGKSVVLRVLADRLARLPDVTVGVINHPQSNLADLYRELGDVFAVPLRPHNRWGGFKILRERWLAHLETTRRRAVLLVDEAQEMSPAALCELRLMASACFDSQPLLCVVLAGDARLIEKLRREELIPLGSRIRTRLATEHASREELARRPEPPAGGRRQCQPDDTGAASHTVRSRRRQLPHPHHDGRRTPGRRDATRIAPAR